MASALLEELKIVATEAKRSQIEDAVGSSWAALAAGRGPTRERDRNATGRSGSRRRGGGEGGGGREGRGGEGGGGGGVGAGVLDSENNGRIRMPGGFARRHDGGPPVEGNLRQESGVA